MLLLGSTTPLREGQALVHSWRALQLMRDKIIGVAVNWALVFRMFVIGILVRFWHTFLSQLDSYEEKYFNQPFINPFSRGPGQFLRKRGPLQKEAEY